MDENVRSNLLHECTHAISDINKYDVTRLTDEAAAYIAQLTYALVLRPSLPEPPIGLPEDNMMRQSMHLVNKYELGSPGGYGAMIDQRDIADLARVVYAIPDYHNIDPDAKLAANGVALSDEQSEEFYRRQMQRLINQDTGGTDSLGASLKAQYASYEDYVTSDNELLTLFDSYRRGVDAQKKTALQKLLRIFLTIDNRAALQLLQRLSAPRKTDIVSERFQSALPVSERTTLLAALRLTR